MHRIAEKLAKKVKNKKHRHACLILDHGNLIAQANNEKGHAEQEALKCLKPLNCAKTGVEDYCTCFQGCTLISIRVKQSGIMGKSKPCLQCSEEIKKHRIRKLIYFDGEKWVEEWR